MAAELRGDVVLVTGGNGFLGQHIVRHLLEDKTVKEIRILDKMGLDHFICRVADTEALVSLKGDLCDKEKCREAVRGVDVVLHCAGLVSYEFPPEVDDLHRNNVTGTKNLLELCLEENVNRFVHCSTTEVTLQSYIPGGVVALVVYSQESRAQPPSDEKKLIVGEYAASKLKAEKMVLAANGRRVRNGEIFRTVALRPPLLYGEGDVKLIWKILEVAKNRGNSLIKLAGVGGKQEMAYVGNVAWSFICAKNALASNNPEKIGGLPIFVTDDTTVENLFRFCERLTRNSDNHVKLSWSIPTPISYLCAFVAEFIIGHLPVGIMGLKKFPVSPRTLIAYLGSIILHNRSRASININYSPIFTREESLELSSAYYSKIFEK